MVGVMSHENDLYMLLKGHGQYIFLFLMCIKHSYGILNFVFLVVDRVQLLRNIIKLSTGMRHLEKNEYANLWRE